MKQLYLPFLILTAILFASFPISAYDFEANGMYFNLISTSEMTCEITSGENKYSGDFKIPESVTFRNRELKVVRVGNWAFSSCKNLTSVTIPNSVGSIGQGAFSSCSFLTTVNIPNSVTMIELWAFKSCNSLTEITIPNSVTIIEKEAFRNCSAITVMSIPSSVTEIGRYAFQDCTNLTTLVIESSENSLGLGVESFKDTQIINLTIGRELINYRYDYEEFTLAYVGLNKFSNLTIFDNIGRIDYLFSLYDYVLYDTFTTLTIGKNNTDYPNNLSLFKQLKTITLKDPTPQKCPEFTNLQYISVNIYVPKGSLRAYQNADGWKNFWNIYESEESGINEIISDAIKTEVARYDLQGRQVSADYRGLIIVCYSDGSVEKVINQ